MPARRATVCVRSPNARPRIVAPRLAVLEFGAEHRVAGVASAIASAAATSQPATTTSSPGVRGRRARAARRISGCGAARRLPCRTAMGAARACSSPSRHPQLAAERAHTVAQERQVGLVELARHGCVGPRRLTSAVRPWSPATELDDVARRSCPRTCACAASAAAPAVVVGEDDSPGGAARGKTPSIAVIRPGKSVLAPNATWSPCRSRAADGRRSGSRRAAGRRRPQLPTSSSQGDARVASPRGAHDMRPLVSVVISCRRRGPRGARRRIVGRWRPWTRPQSATRFSRRSAASAIAASAFGGQAAAAVSAAGGPAGRSPRTDARPR